MSILEVQHIRKSFGNTEVLKDISFSLEEGQVLSIIGSSGSGKTTLLRCLNFLEKPNGGVIKVKGGVLYDSADPATQLESQIREKRLHFGLVFQSFNLFPQYTALGNVMLAPTLHAKERPDYKQNKAQITAQIEAQARDLLTEIGLEDRMDSYPHQLSGGQCQRVAIARAIVGQPQIVLADEPTGNLDSKMGAEVMGLLHRLNKEDGTTIVMVTHNEAQAMETDRIVRFFDGRIIG